MAEVTFERLQAAYNRGLIFVKEMPQIMVHFDNGIHSGMLLLLGPGYHQERDGTNILGAYVRRVGKSDSILVALEHLSLDERTAAHLDRAYQCMQAGPITGSYSQGTRHYNSRGGYRR